MTVKWIINIVLAAVFVAAGVAAWWTYPQWSPLVWPKPQAEKKKDAHAGEQDHVDLTDTTRKNMGLILKPAVLTKHTRTMAIPGTIVNQPGMTRVKVSTPITGFIERIGAFPGQVVKPGQMLFQIHLHSHDLQQFQSDLYKTAKDLEINKKEQKRLNSVAKKGVIPGKELIHLEYEESRLEAKKLALEQSLRLHHFTKKQIDNVVTGKFEDDLILYAPGQRFDGFELAGMTISDSATPIPANMTSTYDLQKLNVNLGDQVQPGQVLCILANHRDLYLQGRAFRPEIPLVEKAIFNDWVVSVDLLSDSGQSKEKLKNLKISWIDSHIDEASQTAGVFLPFRNTEVKTYLKKGKPYRLWKYRPGQRLYLNVPIQENSKETNNPVYVLPREAVAQDGLDYYIFRKNGKVLEKRPVHVLYEERDKIILGKDSDFYPGNVIAYNRADQLMRQLKSSGDEGGGHHHHHHH